MRLVEFIELRNFKRYGDTQRIELLHPAVIMGPNNCGKTSAIQALALWSQAVRTWFAARQHGRPSRRPATALNRLGIQAVPVQRTRLFWHNAQVRAARQDVPLELTVGVWFRERLHPLTVRFRHQGDELVYCLPDEASRADPELMAYAAGLRVELLYPMSGLELEEPVLQAGRIDVLLGQGQTAQVLRNLCLMVQRAQPDDWRQVQELLRRLFGVTLGVPTESPRGSVELYYRQPGVQAPLDVSAAGRGLQQLLLIFAYLYAHRGSVLLIDEPDAHLEILRQRQVYVLLRDIAHQCGSQVVIVTHSEVILEEAIDTNVSLLVGGTVDSLAGRPAIANTLRYFGAEHYVKARERGYVLYVEGSTDLDMLRGMARCLRHPVLEIWDERVNVFYVRDNHPNRSLTAELERVEDGYGLTPAKHFFALKACLPHLVGLAVLDNDGQGRKDAARGGLRVTYWQRYEAENYFITPELLRRHALAAFSDLEIFAAFRPQIDQVLDTLVRRRVFAGSATDFAAYRDAPAAAARLIWEARTERLKLSDFAETFFRDLASRTGGRMLLTKGSLHLLLDTLPASALASEVSAKLDALQTIFTGRAL